MWLGMLKHKKNFVNGLPKGYQLSNELKNLDRPHALPPSILHYLEKHVISLLFVTQSLLSSSPNCG